MSRNVRYFLGLSVVMQHPQPTILTEWTYCPILGVASTRSFAFPVQGTYSTAG